MRQILFTFLLTTIVLTSCQTKNKEAVKEINDVQAFPLVLDTMGIGQLLHLFEDENPTYLSTSNYKFYFIGKFKDTFYLSPFINFSAPPPPIPSGEKTTNKTKITEAKNPFKKYYIEWDEKRNYRNWTQAKINIRFDTANKISKTFPAILTNRDTDTIFIGYGSHIPLIMEAIDSSGNWLPIQEMYIYGCGNGLGSIILPPNECVLTLAPIFKGNYKTKLRLTLGNNHSKPFIGFIDYGQFKSM